jgi:hypothetical protein
LSSSLRLSNNTTCCCPQDGLFSFTSISTAVACRTPHARPFTHSLRLSNNMCVRERQRARVCVSVCVYMCRYTHTNTHTLSLSHTHTSSYTVRTRSREDPCHRDCSFHLLQLNSNQTADASSGPSVRLSTCISFIVLASVVSAEHSVAAP